MNGEIFQVEGDGSCLFNSIAVHILHASNKKLTKKNIREKAKLLRKKAVMFLEKKIKEKNESFLEILGGTINSNKSTLEKAKNYINLMKKRNTWGTQIEIIALQEYIHELGFKRIEVYNAETKHVIKNMKTANNPNATKGIIKIVLNEVNTGGCHYNSILEYSKSSKRSSSKRSSIKLNT